MTLREKIKVAIREDAQARKNIKWDSETQPNLYNLDLFLRKSGYRLIDVQDSEGVPEPMIEATQDAMTHPEIVYTVQDKYFGVRVKEYGIVSREDLDLITRGLQNASEVVKRLNSLDLTKLEINEEEDTDAGNSKETSGAESSQRSARVRR